MTMATQAIPPGNGTTPRSSQVLQGLTGGVKGPGMGNVGGPRGGPQNMAPGYGSGWQGIGPQGLRMGPRADDGLSQLFRGLGGG
jgi:hypothetical protein